MQEDRQRDQLGPLAAADRLVLDRAQERGEAALGRPHRRVDRFFDRLVDQRHLVVDRLVEVDVEVGDDQGAAGARPQLPDRADVPGRERGHFGSRRRLRISSGPWRSIAAGLPCSRIANGAVSPKYWRSMPLASWTLVPLMSSELGVSLSSRLKPKATRTSDEDQGDGERPARVSQHQWRARLSLTLSARVIPRPPAPPHRHACSLAVRAPLSGGKETEDSVKDRFGPARLIGALAWLSEENLKRLLGNWGGDLPASCSRAGPTPRWSRSATWC